MEVSVRPAARAAKWIALTATAIATISLLMWIADLATRPPCPPNYVRLLDVELVAPFISGAIFVWSAVMAGVAHRGSRSRLVSAGAALALGASVVTLAFAVGAVLSHRGPVDNACWTF